MERLLLEAVAAYLLDIAKLYPIGHDFRWQCAELACRLAPWRFVTEVHVFEVEV